MSDSFPERKILPVRSRSSLGGGRRSASNSDQGQLSTPPASSNLSPPTSDSTDSQTRSSDLSLPILSRLEPEDPQSLHTLFSDEKIVVPTENEDLRMPIPVLLNGNSASAEYSPSTPPRRRASLSSQMSELGTSPSLYPHERSVSASSSISDTSFYSDLTSPYDVGSEEPPLEPFFASPFQTALQGGLQIAKDAADAMETAGQSLVAGSDLQRLINDAKELSTFKSSETRTIAVLGDSGEGKNTSR